MGCLESCECQHEKNTFDEKFYQQDNPVTGFACMTMTFYWILFLLGCGCSFRPKDHLGASENTDSLPGFLVNYFCVPNLCVPSRVDTTCRAENIAFSSCAQVIGLGLDRREALGAIWQVRNTPIPCRCVGHRDESASMQVAIRSQQTSRHDKQRVDLQLSDVSDH